jgi:arylsulfatase A-like enzyme
MKKILFIISFFFLISCNQNNTKSKSPNIILITVDDLGWKDLGFMGSKYYETPFLDKLALQSMVFTNAYAGAANCAPSRASLMSGLNTPKHGVYTVGSSERGKSKTRKLIPVKNKKYLHDSIYTLPKMLKSAGYTTAHFGKWHIGEDPKTQGIDYNIGGSKRGNPGRNGYFSPYNIDFIENKKSDEYLTDRLTSEAINFIKKKHTSPFFINLAFYSVHTPLQGKENLIQKYNLKEGVNGQKNSIYGSMVSSVDENVGRILDIINEYNLKENTIIIFTSDNGGIRAISNQHPLRAGKGSYYEGGIRVPFFMRWPNKISSGINKNNVSHLDIYSTLQEIVNPKVQAKKLDGISLKSQFKSPSKLERNIFYHFPIYLEAYNKIEDHGRDPLFRTRPGSVIISGKWKLHHYFEDDSTELYNLETDIGESNDLSDREPEITKRLKESLDNWRLKENAFIPNEKNPFYNSIF